MKFVLLLSQFFLLGSIVSESVNEAEDVNTDAEDAAVGSHRIVNGRNATIQEYPYMIQVIEPGNEDCICSGAIIGRVLALTAAHCFRPYEFKPEHYHLRSGSSYKNGKGGTLHAIKQLKIHVFFHSDVDIHGYDVAIVQVRQPFKFDDVRQKIPISRSNAKTGETAVMAGWGYLDMNETIRTTILQAGNVTMMTHDDCLSKTSWTHMHENNFCAGGTTISRRGDSGTPLVSNGKIFGINSYGHRLDDGNYPSVFVSLAALHSHLESTMWMMPSNDVEFV